MILPEFINQIDFEYSFAILNQYVSLFWFYFPLGVIGISRWTSWSIKKFIARFYRPKRYPMTSTVSVITPVYNENPAVFAQALSSWKENDPTEIIAVIDYSDKNCIAEFLKFKKAYPSARLVVTKTPGKREALADGIKIAKGKMVALVDSDTIWSKDVLKHSLSPFFDPNVGGVVPRQAVLVPKTLSQIIFDIQLYIRYHDEFPFLSASGTVLSCLSGRTAFYRRNVVLPFLDKLVNETFLGEKVISGEDKRLTYLIQAAGWKTYYQSLAVVYTPGTESLRTLFSQRLRWSRNGWRADIRAIFQGWVIGHPALTFHLIDRIIQPFTMIMGLVYFFVSLLYGFWVPTILIVIWWNLGRLIKIYPYLKSRGINLAILPFYVLSTFVFAFTKLYALTTLNTQGWITRWDSVRLPRVNFLKSLAGQAGVSVIVLTIAIAILTFRQSSLVPAAIASGYQSTKGLVEKDSQIATSSLPSAVLAISDVNILPFVIYEIQQGESVDDVARRFGLPVGKLIAANSVFLPNWSWVRPGTFIAIPDTFPQENPPVKYNNYQKYSPKLAISYEAATNTIKVEGRGNLVTLASINRVVGDNHLRQEAPKDWVLSSNLEIGSGVTFRLEENEVSWLKLLSTKDGFARISVDNGALAVKGVKITSWDDESRRPDKRMDDGRSYLSATFGSLVHIENSELAYLGYEAKEQKESLTSGLALKNPEDKIDHYPLTGEIISSKFHHNYEGLYLSGVTGMSLVGNEFFLNTTTGMRMLNSSSQVVIVENKFSQNGVSGLVVAKKSNTNLISGNQVAKNSQTGLLLDHVEANIVENNSFQESENGLVLKSSLANRIKSNSVSLTKRGLEISSSSRENLVENNRFSDNSLFGLLIKDGGDGNKIAGNKFSGNSIAVYVKGKGNMIQNNFMEENKTGIYLAENASLNILEKNDFLGNELYQVYLRTNEGKINYLVSR